MSDNSEKIAYSTARLEEMDSETRKKAVDHFRSLTHYWPVDDFRALFEKYGLSEWFWHIYDAEIADMKEQHGDMGYFGPSPHMGWGMSLRNSLRIAAGLEDDLLPAGNWDDYYVPCLEAALGFREEP